MKSGLAMNGSPPSNWWTVAPCARNSITLLRILTMSEKPTSSSLEASRKPVCDVVTVCNVPPDPDVGQRIIAWLQYSVYQDRRLESYWPKTRSGGRQPLCDTFKN